MKALVFDGKQTGIKNVEKPVIDEDFNVLVKVVYSGICKTDVYVSSGKMGNVSPIVLGHEFCGYVEETLSDQFKVGDFIACNPILNNKKMLGVDYNGSFAEYVKVPASQCYIFKGSNKKLAAYIEPLAASMAPLQKKEQFKDKKIGIVGKDRIGKLTESVLKKAGLNASFMTDFKDNSMDVIIETWAEENVLDSCLDGLKEGGSLILKSRNYNKVPLDLYKVVRKNIKLEGMYYFEDYKYVIDMANDFSELEAFLGQDFAIEDWQAAFEESKDSYQKIFLRMF